MRVRTLQGFLASALLWLGSAGIAGASLISTSMFTPLTPTGNVTVIALNSGVSLGNSQILGLGYTIDFSTDSNQGVVTGRSAAKYAPPVAGVTAGAPEYLTGDYGSPLTTSVSSSGDYLSTGIGSITITFAAPQTSFALLWGSVDKANKLTFNNSTHDAVTGADVQTATPGFMGDGNQGAGGSVYVMVNPVTPFTSVTASSSDPSFEFSAVAGAPLPVGVSALDPVPEPSDMLLLGTGLIAFAFLGLRKTRKS